MNGYPSRARVPAPDPLAGLREALRTARPDADVDLLRRAYDVAASCHQGQFRRSGDPHITHPVSVAAILAGLGADDQTLCAAILHDTVHDTPYTLTALSREFGPGTAAMVAGIMALDSSRWRWGYKAARAITAVQAADTRVLAMKLADRLHNMQTIRFLPQVKQLRKARESLDVLVPAGERLSMHTVTSELETLASTTLTRRQVAGHGVLGLPRQALALRRPLAYQRTVVALDIERSTSRPDPVKAELRATMYMLFDAALRAADIHRRHRDRFADRGDGLLALIHPDHAPRVLLRRVIPAFGLLLAEYNAGRPPQRQLRVRVVVHAGTVFYDANGCFGETLDAAFRLLDAPSVKGALQAAQAPLVLVVSARLDGAVYPGEIGRAFPPVSHLLDRKGVGTAAMAGLSMGGLVVMELAAAQPERWWACGFIATTAQRVTEQERAARLDSARTMEEQGMRPVAEQMAARLFGPWAGERLTTTITEMMLATSPVGAAAAVRGRAERPDYHPVLKSLRAPSLVCAGDRDSYSTAEVTSELAGCLPDPEVVVMAGCGHLPNLEQPDDFNRHLLSFLNRALP